MKPTIQLFAVATAVVCAASATPSVLNALAGVRLMSIGHSQGLTKCPKCGKKVDPKWKFCDKCGTKLVAKKPNTTGGGAGTTSGGGTGTTSGGGTGTTTGGGTGTGATTANMHAGHASVSTKGPVVGVDSTLGVMLTSGAQVARGIGINNDGSAIVYGGNSGATTDIFRLSTSKPLNTPERLSSDDSGAEFDPDYGPQGSRIVYVSEGSKGGSFLQLRDLVRDRVQSFTIDSGIAWQPRISPDGKQLVYVKKDNDRSPGDLYLLNTVTMETKQLTSGPANDESPSWDPQGCHIAFESDRSGSQQIWSVSPSTLAARQISKGAFPHKRPSWSKRGYIIYESNFTLRAMNENGVEGQLGTGLPIAGSLPRVSGDGSTLAFERRQSLGVEAFIMRLK